MAEVSFDAPDVARVLESLSQEKIDALPFGVIRIAEDGTVLLYSATEARLSGFGERRAIGRNFFTLIAPCTDTPRFRGRLQEAALRGELDFELGHTGDFDDPGRFVRFRVCSASGGGYWLLAAR